MRRYDTIINLKIQAKGLLCQESLNFSLLQSNCRLEFENRNISKNFTQKYEKNVGIFYNKCSMARGIFFDGRKMNQGEVRLCLSLPTTHTEICDFIRIVTEIKLQYKNIQLICDDFSLTMEQFVQGKENYLHYSLATLRELCSKNVTTLELVHVPYTFTLKEQKYFANKGTLEDLQVLLHHKQVEKRNDVGLEIIQDEDGNDQAIFALIANFPTILPIRYEDSVYLAENPVDSAVICFYSEPGEPLDQNNYDYDVLIQLLIDFGADYLDETHLSLPGFTEEELNEIAIELTSLEV